MDGKPTHEQAQLHLQVYDQRREAKLRQARDWFGKNYIVTSIDDAMRLAPMGSETGAYVAVPCSTTAFCTKTCFLRPTENSSRFGKP